MKNLFRKIEALLVATVMILSMCTAAFASNAAMAAGHATIKGITPENNITVTAYKIIDYNANGTYSPVLDGTIDMNADGSLNPTAANVAALATDKIGYLPTHFEIAGPEANGDYITSDLTPGTWGSLANWKYDVHFYGKAAHAGGFPEKGCNAIVAAANGTVKAANYSSAAGNYVMIDHGGGLYTVYMHCSSLAVSEGTAVSAGQTIAYVGSTGISTGNHLHFGVSLNGSYVSPWSYLKG